MGHAGDLDSQRYARHSRHRLSVLLGQSLIHLVGRRQYTVAVFGLFRAPCEPFSPGVWSCRPGFCDRDAL